MSVCRRLGLGLGRLGRGRRRQHAPGRQLRRLRPGQQLLGLDRHGVGLDAVVDFLVLVGRHQPARVLGLDAGRGQRRLHDQRLEPLAACLHVLVMRPPHDRAEARDGGDRDHRRQDLSTLSVDPRQQRVPRRRRNRFGFVSDGPRRRIEPHGNQLVRSVDSRSVAGRGPADVHFFISFHRRVLRRRP